jgi:DNA polymerase-1
MKFDLSWLRHLGVSLDHKPVFCTMVAEYVLTGQERLEGLSLDDLSNRYGITPKIDRVKMYWDSGYETDEIPLNILIPYCEQDAANALAIYYRQVPKIKELGLVPLVSLEMETLKVLADMEYNGMLLDRKKLQQYSEEYGARIEELNREITNTLGIENAGSDQQLSCGLFGGSYKVDCRVPGKREGTTRQGKEDKRIEGLGFSPIGNIGKSGYYSVAIPTIQQLVCKTETQRRVKELLLEHSKYSQLKSTYFDGLQERMQEDNRVHPSINQTIARNGRLSCSNPNLQNQPRGNTGPVKECFVTRFR